jgi:23S rRNA pseudouridine1911/1915/1917 synthase
MAAPHLDILYEDDAILVLCKPSGRLTQAAPGIDSMELRIKAFLKDRDHKTGVIYLGVPHRLDRPVSGVMVYGKNQRATRRISQQFEARSVEKIYWACVAGRVEPDAGTWKDHLLKVPGEARAEVVEESHPDAREAVLHYRVTEALDDRSLLEITLETGRTHQIRIQTGTRGHAVWGDQQYGSTSTFGEQFEDRRSRAIALHSRRMMLHHPMTNEPIDMMAPLPAAWGELGLSLPD